MNETETRAEYIDKQLTAAGWGVVEGSRIRRETSYQRKLAALDELEMALLHQAFTGEL